jgi:hypothetical protein
MDTKMVRKPFKIGVSKALTMPLNWRKFDTVTVYEDRGLLIIAPPGLEDRAEKLMQSFEDYRQKAMEV